MAVATSLIAPWLRYHADPAQLAFTAAEVIIWSGVGRSFGLRRRAFPYPTPDRV